jgi:HemY protein
MLSSLIKVVLFIASIAGLTFAADYMLATQEGVRIAAGGWEVTLGPFQMLILVLLLLFLFWLLIKAIGLLIATARFLNGDETAISRYFDRNRERKGYQALNEGFIALASGEGRLALIRAQRAQKYLSKPELTTLLIAQAAQATGDTARATEAYKALLQNDATRFVGISGLLNQKLASGDLETALKLAEHAFALKPKHTETQDTLLKLQSQSGNWKDARKTLAVKHKSGALPKDVYRRRDAVLALQEAKGILDETQTIEAREAAITANKLSPDLVPAATMAARALVEKGDKKAATRILRKAWEARTHPDLAEAFAEIEPEETPVARIKRFKALTDLHPEEDETRLLLSELYLAAEDFPFARRTLGNLATEKPTQRSLALMAALERGQGADDAVVRGWLAKAMTAPQGAQWCCDKCQATHSAWAPICDNCQSFDSLSWREPPLRKLALTGGLSLLPMLLDPAVSTTDAPKDPAGIVAAVRGGTS